MAVLGKIREKSMLLIVIIALGLFAFVIDPTTIINLLNGSQNKEFVGKVNDETIAIQDYATKVERMKSFSRPGASQKDVLNQVWDQEIRSILVGEQVDALGLSIEKDQLWDLIVQASQNDPTYQTNGVFDEGLLREQIAKSIETDRRFWKNIEDQYAANPQQILYYNLIRAGIGATEKDGEQAYRLENDKVDLQFVGVPYTSISDDEVSVSKEEITAYMNKHKEKYEREATTDIKYVLFKEAPSAADDAAVKARMEELLTDREEPNRDKVNEAVKGFSNAEDAALYVDIYSDVKFDSIYKLPTEVYAGVSDTIFKMEPGMMSEIYKEGQAYKVSKVLGFKDHETKETSQIVIAYKDAVRAPANVTRTKEEAQKVADSLYGLIKGGEDFEALARTNSNIPQSATQGGKMGYTPREGLKPELVEWVFDEAKVDGVKVIESDLGYHIVKVTGEKSERKVLLATIQLNVEPSKETLDQLYRDAQNFELQAAKEGFDELAKTQNLTPMPVNKIDALSDMLNGVTGSQRQMIKWTFDEETNKGDVKSFEYPNGHIVVQLVDRKAKGLPFPEDTSLDIAPILRKEKKAKMIRDKNAGATMDSFASSNGKTVEQASAVSMQAPLLPGRGNEPKVVGTAFGMKEGATSAMIDGANGVYMIKVLKVTPAINQDSYKKFADQATLQNTNAIGTKVIEALKKMSEIEDNRSDIY